MAISEPMLAQALKEYLGDPPGGFKNYLAVRYPKEKIDDFTFVTWAKTKGKGLTLQISKESTGAGITSSRDYVITIKRSG